MYVLHDVRLVFLAQPKTASKATVRWLERICKEQIQIIGGHHSKGKNGVGYETYTTQGYEVVSTVRNHWDILVSFWYLHYHNSYNHWKPDFGEYVEEFVLRHRQGHIVRGDDGYKLFSFVPLSTHIIRYENLVDEWSALMRDRGNTEYFKPFPLFNQSKPHRDILPERTHYSTYYTPETRDFVAENFTHEIAEFGYEFEKWPNSKRVIAS